MPGTPALTGPDREPGERMPETITLEWDVTVSRKTTMDLDHARRLFGLVGTSDEDVHSRVAVLCQSFPHSLVPKLGSLPCEEKTSGHRLRTVNGAALGDL